MQMTYDPAANAIYAILGAERHSARVEMLTDDLILDYGVDGDITGAELLDATIYGFDPAHRTVGELVPVFAAAGAIADSVSDDIVSNREAELDRLLHQLEMHNPAEPLEIELLLDAPEEWLLREQDAGSVLVGSIE